MSHQSEFIKHLKWFLLKNKAKKQLSHQLPLDLTSKLLLDFIKGGKYYL